MNIFGTNNKAVRQQTLGDRCSFVCCRIPSIVITNESHEQCIGKLCQPRGENERIHCTCVECCQTSHIAGKIMNLMEQPVFLNEVVFSNKIETYFNYEKSF